MTFKGFNWLVLFYQWLVPCPNLLGRVHETKPKNFNLSRQFSFISCICPAKSSQKVCKVSLESDWMSLLSFTVQPITNCYCLFSQLATAWGFLLVMVIAKVLFFVLLLSENSEKKTSSNPNKLLLEHQFWPFLAAPRLEAASCFLLSGFFTRNSQQLLPAS